MVLYAWLARALDACRRRAGLVVVKTHSLYTPPLGPDSVVVDLGANVGDFTQEVNRRFGCTCHAIEANPEMAARIERNDRVLVYNQAIAERDGPVTIVLSSNPEATSMLPEVAEQYGVRGTIECPGVTLEHFLQANRIARVDLLKVDIEGAERELFQSTGEATLRGIGQITIEFYDFIPRTISSVEVRRIRRRLERLGFVCLPFSYMFPGMETCDLLFVNLRVCRGNRRTRWTFWIIKALLRLQWIKVRLKFGGPHRDARAG